MSTLSTQLAEFLALQYPPSFPGYVSVWERAGKRTEFFQTSELPQLVSRIAVLAATTDVYLSLGTQRERPAKGRRGGAAGVAAVPGFFLDIDFASMKDSAKNYPIDEAEALGILAAFAVQPTATIRTGNGLHCHFQLTKPFIINDPSGFAVAKKVWSRFQQCAIAHFKAHGRDIDSVGDLARNWRPPGTFNHKTAPAKPVELVTFDADRRYDLGLFEELVSRGASTAAGSTERKAAGRLLEPDHDLVVQECSWYRDVVVEGAATCDEPNWFAGASIAALCRDGARYFHDFSRRHPDYAEAEAAAKFERAVSEAGPRTCESVQRELGYEGCLTCPHQGEITSPIQLGRPRKVYEPGRWGPRPLGYTKDGLYAFLDPSRQIVVSASANQLLSSQYLLGLANREFWVRQFPGGERGKFDFIATGEALIDACKRAGPFVPARVRGRGIWLEGGEVVVNLGAPLNGDLRNLYVCFEPIAFERQDGFETERLLDFLRLFNWRNKQDAILMLGWLAIAPICGVLSWRPHLFVYGPARCGKTTIHSLAARVLHPLVISTDGQSSEAGIRQTLGPDSLPILIDEFESDQHGSSLRGVIRLARSASSADNPVLRGTPEGKAMTFSLRTTFFFSAINPTGMSPADESRIVLLELLMHENDPVVANRIIAEDRHFRGLGVRWCGYMASMARFIPDSIQTFEHGLPSIDRRHRQNMATLLAGAFVSLNGRAPTEAEATTWAADYTPTVELHAEALDRDDAGECLDHLFSHIVEGYPLGHWCGMTVEGAGNDRQREQARKIMRMFDMQVHEVEGAQGLLIRNHSPQVGKVFTLTRWESGGWMRALRKVDGAFVPKNPVHFPGTGTKNRCVSIPLELVPDATQMGDSDEAPIDAHTGQTRY